MDTRFWGPDGWRLLHCIAIGYPENPSIKDKQIYSEFFTNLKYVLPCIYCRNSFTEYTDELNIMNYLNSKKDLFYWLYLIHNKVNNKLRNQGLIKYNDPNYDDIYDHYCNYYKETLNNNCILIDGWNFIYCIYFNYPDNIKDLHELPKERKEAYVKFILLLPYVIPFKKIIYAIQYVINNRMKEFDQIFLSRDKLTKLIYEIENSVKEATSSNCISYNKRCSLIESHRAGCKNNTCRLTKH